MKWALFSNPLTYC